MATCRGTSLTRSRLPPPGPYRGMADTPGCRYASRFIRINERARMAAFSAPRTRFRAHSMGRTT
ncbi:hypothetical protein T484DRAFT_1934156 [Baffinella frigidus]|nr:hypothetical protein T484DRAFT_1934156 [Cryptophyta sp. CCMP2293]